MRPQATRSEGSDTYSANPLCCAAVVATLDEFAARDVLGPCRKASAVLEAALVRLKQLPIVANVRGEKGGMVWGVEMNDHAGRTAAEWASAAVLACYRGEGENGILREFVSTTVSFGETRDGCCQLFGRLF